LSIVACERSVEAFGVVFRDFLFPRRICIKTFQERTAENQDNLAPQASYQPIFVKPRHHKGEFAQPLNDMPGLGEIRIFRIRAYSKALVIGSKQIENSAMQEVHAVPNFASLEKLLFLYYA
jgi:hypothetical protein